jgi:DNA-directed RNA polymerase subunit M/transcription elongation factor TFIIS
MTACSTASLSSQQVTLCLSVSGSRKIVVDERIVLDQTMPRLTVECPECGFHEAVYMATSDEGERKMLVRLVCSRGADKGTVKCGFQWDLEEDLHIFRNRVMDKDEFKLSHDGR